MNKTIPLKDIFPLIEEQLNQGGFTVLTIHGTSMLPFLRDGADEVRLEKPKAPPKKYDVIFYRRQSGEFILHRITAVKKDGLACRGDNQLDTEYPVDAGDVIAVMTQYNRKGDWKPMDCLWQRAYAIIWVNTVIIRKIFRKAISLLRRK